MSCFILHDWEPVDFHVDPQDNSWPQRVCLRCGTIQIRGKTYGWMSPGEFQAWQRGQREREDLARRLVARGKQ